MKLIFILAATFGITKAAFCVGHDLCRWTMGQHCVTMKENVANQKHARLFMKKCVNDNSSNSEQKFLLSGDQVTSNDGKRCLYFNTNTKILSMVKINRIECKEDGAKFTRDSSARIHLSGSSTDCVKPQSSPSRSFNKLVLGPGCTMPTTLTKFKNKTSNSNSNTMTYPNVIFSTIKHFNDNNSNSGVTELTILSYIKANYPTKFDEDWLKRFLAKMLKNGSVKTVTQNDKVFYHNFKSGKCDKGIRGKCDNKKPFNKKTNNYPKMIFDALKLGGTSYQTATQIGARMKSKFPTLNVDKKAVELIVTIIKKDENVAVENNGNNGFRLKDLKCNKGLKGQCDNKQTHSKKTKSYNKVIFGALKESGTDGADLTKINGLIEQNEDGSYEKSKIEKILENISSLNSSNVKKVGDKYALKDLTCGKGLSGVCDNKGTGK